MDARIIELTAGQHGVVTRRQLLAAGLPADTIRSLVRSKRLRRVSYGVYVLPGTPETVEQELMIAALRCGPNARVAGERVLGLLGVVGAARDGGFVVLTRPGRVVTGVDWRVRESTSAVGEADVVGIPSFNRERNVIEAAVHGDDTTVERLVDGLRWSSRGTAVLLGMCRDLIDHPGADRLVRSGLLDDDAGESPPERVVHDALLHLAPVRQVLLCDHRVDIYIPAARLVIEYDGALHQAPARRRADAARDADLREAGYEVKRLTAEDLEDLPSLVAEIEAIVARRAVELADA